MADRFKLIAFDVDGTLTKGNIWQRLHTVAGISPSEDRQWFLSYYNKTISFDEWAKKIIDRYKQSRAKRNTFESAMKDVVFVPDTQEVIQALQSRCALCLISSGVDIYVRNVAKRLGITLVHANYSFVYNQKNEIIDIHYEAPEDQAKVIFLKKICKERNIQPEDIVFVGDSSNDLEAFRFTKHGILVGKGNEALQKASWKQADTLKDILGILL